jgi:hypothetical protein
MGVMFESVLLFSLAVLIILVGLLVYYFKKRIVDVEQKNATCLELVQDVYSEHIKLRNQMMMMVSFAPSHSHSQSQSQLHSHMHTHLPSQAQEDGRIKIELSEDDDSDDESLDNESIESNDDDSDNDDGDDDDSDDENEDKVKIVSVDLKFPEEFEVNIDEDLNEEDAGESELQSLDTSVEPVVVNKVGPAEISKDELKKLTPTALKTLLVGKGVSADEIGKMKKNELIQKLISLN